MKNQEVFRRAAELINRGWCQGAYAKNRLNQRCISESDEANQWCAWGALMRACQEIRPDVKCSFFVQKVEKKINKPIAEWNDNLKKPDDIIMLFEALANQE